MGDLIVLSEHRRGGRTKAELAAHDDREELTALLAEGRELGYQIVSLARLAQRRLSIGASPARQLDTIERLAVQHESRMIAAEAARKVVQAARAAAQPCPDERRRSFGHGRAA